MPDAFATDGPISLPVPPTRPVLVDFGGFGFTTGGLAHNITTATIEDIFANFFQPPGVTLYKLPPSVSHG